MSKGIQNYCETLGKWGCLAFSYTYAALEDIASPEELNVPDFLDTAILTNVFLHLKNNKYLDDECTVLDAANFMKSINGITYKVSKKDISSLDDLKNVERACVLFEYDGKGHFVYCKFGKIVYNSIPLSKCVHYGKPTSARIIERC